jgi:hypothetical protein
MAARGRETDQPNEARGNPSRPGLHLTPDKQAGYMTATEFQIALAIQPLTRAGSIYAWRSGVDSNLRCRAGFYGREFGPSLARYPARQKASMLERICSPLDSVLLRRSSVRFIRHD